jgi:hypothetical protein
MSETVEAALAARTEAKQPNNNTAPKKTEMAEVIFHIL